MRNGIYQVDHVSFHLTDGTILVIEGGYYKLGENHKIKGKQTFRFKTQDFHQVTDEQVVE